MDIFEQSAAIQLACFIAISTIARQLDPQTRDAARQLALETLGYITADARLSGEHLPPPDTRQQLENIFGQAAPS